MVKNKKVSCIIPAYNEENRISNVLKVVVNHPLIDEVIVVNDCSKDNTLEKIRAFKKVKVLDNKKNLGKTASVLRALKISKHEIAVFIDADLLELNKKNISDLILPVLTGKSKTSLAMLGNLPVFKIIGADSGSGQRALIKNLLNFKKIAELAPYGLESYINSEIIKNKYPIKIITWENVICTTKGEKANSAFPFWSYVSMWIQMIKTSGFFAFLFQSFQLARLNIKS
ncbi:glycosyltransferase [Candidatus Pacearchaeota archaeon]|nr:glycosyltransferase [Candidatus Pacearchaeota archaeon]